MRAPVFKSETPLNKKSFPPKRKGFLKKGFICCLTNAQSIFVGHHESVVSFAYQLFAATEGFFLAAIAAGSHFVKSIDTVDRHIARIGKTSFGRLVRKCSQ